MPRTPARLFVQLSLIVELIKDEAHAVATGLMRSPASALILDGWSNYHEPFSGACNKAINEWTCERWPISLRFYFRTRLWVISRKRRLRTYFSLIKAPRWVILSPLKKSSTTVSEKLRQRLKVTVKLVNWEHFLLGYRFAHRELDSSLAINFNFYEAATHKHGGDAIDCAAIRPKRKIDWQWWMLTESMSIRMHKIAAAENQFRIVA